MDPRADAGGSPTTPSGSADAGVEVTEDEKNAVLNLLAQPAYLGERYARQAIGEAHLELRDMDQSKIYFSLPASAVSHGDAKAAVKRVSASFLRHSGDIEIASDQGGTLALSGYTMPRSAATAVLFATGVDNVRFAQGLVFRFPFRSATYTVTPGELKRFSQNAMTYSGYLNADISQYADAMGTDVLSNRGPFAARPGEPSLKRLIDQLLIPGGRSGHEERIQCLTDFVTKEIETDYQEASEAGEILKRPDETLMTGRGSGGNKAVLLASLLEQIGEDYILVYGPRRVWIAVPQGRFRPGNGLVLRWANQKWVLIDVTAAGFRIGVSQPDSPPAAEDLLFVERPRANCAIIDRAAGVSLGFR